MGAVQTMRGVIGAAIETFGTFYDTRDTKASIGPDLIAAAQACLLRLYSWRPNETIEAIVDSAVEEDQLRVSFTENVIRAIC